jgi:long-chain acyl-CoA synthetase
VLYTHVDLEGRLVEVSVGDAVRTIEAVARQLREGEFLVGDRVAIYGHNSATRVFWELGVILAGGVCVSLTPNSIDTEVKAIIDETEPTWIIVQSSVFRDRLSSLSLESKNWIVLDSWVPVMEELGSASHEYQESLRQLDPMAPAWIVYTSGTTGMPKGVMLSLDNLSFAADCLVRQWNLPFAHGRLFSFLPLSHVAEKLHTIAVAMSQRYQVHLCQDFERFAEELKVARPTLFLAVPRVWSKLRDALLSKIEDVPEFQKRALGKLWSWSESSRWLEFPRDWLLTQVRASLGLGDLRLAVSGAAKLSPEVSEWFMHIGILIHEVYGMSETAGVITASALDQVDPESVGRPVSGVEVKIGPDGEIRVHGRNVFLGYYKKKEETTAALVDGWLLTGDLGEWSMKSGDLKIIGRNREIVKLTNGRMVSPSALEAAIQQLPEVSQACIVGDGRAHLGALITLKDSVLLPLRFQPGALEGIEIVSQDIRLRVREHLDQVAKDRPGWEHIRQFAILSREFSVDEHELTPSMKLRRGQIERNFSFLIEQMHLEESNTEAS